jgi:hypothetical protein
VTTNNDLDDRGLFCRVGEPPFRTITFDDSSTCFLRQSSSDVTATELGGDHHE